MRKMKLLLAVAGVMSIAGANAPVQSIKVVANATVRGDKISTRELKSVYLGKTTSLGDGTRVEPVLEKGGPAHEIFLKHYLGQSNEQLQVYYRSLVFSGKASMPKEVGSDAEMIAYVARTKNAIGYVSADADTEGLKTLIIEGANERKLMTRVEPEYPDVLRKNHIGGIVRLSVTVAPNGSVEGIEVLGGNPALVTPARDAVMNWVYAPGPSRTVIEVSIPFDAKR